MEPWQYLLSTEKKLNGLLHSDFNPFPLDAFWLYIPKFPAHRTSWVSARLLFCQLLGKAPKQQICCLYFLNSSAFPALPYGVWDHWNLPYREHRGISSFTPPTVTAFTVTEHKNSVVQGFHHQCLITSHGYTSLQFISRVRAPLVLFP